MSKHAAHLYASPHDLGDPYINRIVSLVPSGATVLDVGCANGRLARLLLDKGCIVDGIEIDAILARTARGLLRAVFEVDVQSDSLEDIVPGRYDVIVASDLLEHLADPACALSRLRSRLEPSGRVVAGIPNFLFAPVRLRLAIGRFAYDPSGGILDENHMRFFSLSSARRTCAVAGLRENRFWPIPPHSSRLVSILGSRRAAGAVLSVLARVRPGLFARAFVFELASEA